MMKFKLPVGVGVEAEVEVELLQVLDLLRVLRSLVMCMLKSCLQNNKLYTAHIKL